MAKSAYPFSLLLFFLCFQYRVESNGTTMPIFTKNLTVGVPKKDGFTEFVSIKELISVKELISSLIHDHHRKNKSEITGYCIDVFEAVIDALPFHVPYKYKPFTNETGEMAGSYNDLLSKIDQKEYDIVVGDTTIVANRTSMVDFALPYTESGVTMLVRIRHDKPKIMWIFIRPFTWDLWLTIIMACIFIGLVIRFMERRENTEFNGPPQQQLGKILWFPFQLLAFPDREMVVNKFSMYVMVIWLFMAYILMQSYTACLSSILTVDQLEPTFVSVNELKRKNLYVGYQKDSFVKEMLINQLNFNASTLKEYSSVHEYYEALSGKTKDGGVAAIFDEIPYLKVFLVKHSSKFMLVGPTYRTGGFGFAFRIGSDLVPFFSRAILNVTEDRKVMDNIEKKYFGKTMFDEQATQIYPDSSSPSLDTHSFAGLFLIAGIATLLVLFGSEGYLWQKPVAVARQYSQKLFSSQPSKPPESTAESAIE